MPSRPLAWFPTSLPRLAAFVLLAVLAAAQGACVRAAGPAGGPLPQFSQYEGREVKEVRFEGDLLLPEDSIDRVVTTRASTCGVLFLKICPLGVFDNDYFLDLEVLSRDVVRVQLLYRDHGYYGTRVVPMVQETEDQKLTVRFAITPGDRVVLRSLTIEGADHVIAPDSLERRLPLKEGEPFSRIAFLASVDTVRNALLERGHAYARVLRNYEIDTIYDVASVNLVAAPGPVVTIDTILFSGNYRLSQEIARRQLSIDEGDRLKASELARSQVNLYDLELVDFAAVEVAPESLQVTPDSVELDADSIGSTVIVRLVEAPRYLVDVSGGYGTLDCLRARGSHVDRDFLGEARRLEISGLVAKVGVGKPLDAGLEDSLCREFSLDNAPTAIDTTIAEALNYRIAADFLQPRLFGTQTSVVATLYAERISEFGLYLREARGGTLGAVRSVARGTVVTGNVSVERGSTLATDFFFCVAFEVCLREEIDPLKRDRWSNVAELGVVRNRVRLDPFPSGGHTLRATTDYSSALLGSEDRFLRLQGDGSLYREVKRDWVVQFRLAGGSFLEGIVPLRPGRVPPEQFFYAGGPNSVRGFGRNELGPRVYVRRISEDEQDDGTIEADTTIDPSPTGGTRMVFGTVELTIPSPFQPEALRLAAFVDGGGVWDSQPLTPDPGLRFTPGIGVRYATPLGPFRLDLALNPYGPVPGPLYEIGPDGRLANGGRPVEVRYEPEDDRKLWQYLTLQLSLGQTF